MNKTTILYCLLALMATAEGIGAPEQFINLPRASFTNQTPARTSQQPSPLSGSVRKVKSVSSSLKRENAIAAASLIAESIKGGAIAIVADTLGVRMSPAIPPGSILVLEDVVSDSIRINDVITFRNGSGQGISRVSDINMKGIQICSDQSNLAEYIAQSDLRKRVVAVIFCCD